MLPTRRQVLLAAGVLTAGACTAKQPLRPTVAPLRDSVRARAVQRERDLVALYEQAVGAAPARRALLAAILGDHSAHLAALTAGASPTPSPSPSAAVVLPRDRLTPQALQAAERDAAAAHAQDVLALGGGCDPDLVPLLASLAACEASHAALL